MLQDSITLQWDASVIAVILAPYVVNNQIDTVGFFLDWLGRLDDVFQILTFDTHGISSHPNHYSLPFGAWHLVNTLRSKAPAVSVPRILNLVTVSLLPKYAGVLASIASRRSMVSERILKHFFRNYGNQRAVFTSGFKQYATAVHAMREHTSQSEWFRYLYVAFSRFMWVNEWVEVKPSDVFPSS